MKILQVRLTNLWNSLYGPSAMLSLISDRLKLIKPGILTISCYSNYKICTQILNDKIMGAEKKKLLGYFFLTCLIWFHEAFRVAVIIKTQCYYYYYYVSTFEPKKL